MAAARPAPHRRIGRLGALLRGAAPIALVLTIARSSAAQELALPELAARTKPAVVLLTVSDRSGRNVGSGTGFVVSPGGRVVTNHHVVEGAGAVTATFADGRDVEVLGVLEADAVRDIAILQIAAADLPSLPLGDLASLRVGDEIVVFGSPLGLSGSLSTGVVAAVRERGVVDSLPPDAPAAAEQGLAAWGLQITAAISPGSSGSPILNRRGEVVGVAVGIMTRGQGLNFGVPVGVVKETLARVAPDAKPAPFGEGSAVIRNLGISAVALLGLALAYVVWSWVERRSAGRRAAGSSARPRR